MNLTIETIAKYLGNDASVLLTDLPFKNWNFEISFENEVEKPRIDYVFSKEGLDIVCDSDNKVRTIFLYNDLSRKFNGEILDLPLNSSRKSVLARLGLPSKSGGKTKDPILGDYGQWDRFVQSDYVIHIEYRFGVDIVNKITFMRSIR